MSASPASIDDTSPTVLVVDDEPDVRQIAGLMLRRGGYEVIEASDGRAAVEVVSAHRDDIAAVLLDVMMPEMRGPQALRAIRDLAPALPVIFFSGFDRNEVAEHLNDPYTSFLGKPFSKQELLDQVQQAVRAGGPGED